jgi:hypothetical protein
LAQQPVHHAVQLQRAGLLPRSHRAVVRRLERLVPVVDQQQRQAARRRAVRRPARRCAACACRAARSQSSSDVVDLAARVRDERDLETERDTLIGLVQRFGFAAPEEMDGRVHSFFGPLTAAEWDTLMWRHIDHHARQFGV